MLAKIQYLYTMDYQSCIDYLYTKLPMFSRTGAAALKMDLSNTISLCEALGNPQKKFKTIHVAGTNGKGSVSHLIASILQEAGYKTGLYTSPHLMDFRERIRINGNMISKENVVDFTEKISHLIEAIEPSFFEVTVAMAFNHFAEECVEVAVIETGLGGRLDSTNIINPEISIITNIGLDHVQLLGNTFKLIATEKAGIIKGKTPVVIGQTMPETAEVFKQKALEMQAPIVFSDALWEAIPLPSLSGTIAVELVNPLNREKKVYHSDLAGIYQSENIRTVVTAVEILVNTGWKIDALSIASGIAHAKKNTGLQGRWETIHKNPYLILDVAHNTEGMRQVIHQINASGFDNLYIVLGMSKDKDIGAVLEMLPLTAQYGYTKADIPRALEVETLSSMANAIGLNGECFGDVNTAIEHFSKKAGSNDLILVCGSVFVVGEVDRGRWVQ